MRDDVPAEAVAELDTDQHDFLASLADAAESQSPGSGEAWQALVFSTARDRGLPPAHAFSALYRSFLGRPNGPRAGWLLASLAPAFVIARLRAVADVGAGTATI